MSERILHLLLLDSSACYSPALSHTLETAGLNIHIETVETPEAFRAALTSMEWDVVFSAYTACREALTVIDGRFPLVVLCEPPEEDHALALAEPGVSDVLPVTQLNRLPFIVRRELRSPQTGISQTLLRESDAKYRLLAEYTADVIWILDTETMRFSYVSPSVERLRGYTPEEVLAQPMNEVVTPDSLAMISETLPERLRAFDAGDPAVVVQTHEVEQFRKDGSTVWTEVVTRLLRSSTGSVQVVGVSRDISARKQTEDALQESEGRYRRILDNMLEGFQIIDFDWRYFYVNDSAARHGRWAKEDLIGQTMMERYPGIENTAMFAALRRSMQARTFERMENEFIYPDGSAAWFELSIQPVPEGVSVFSLDITDRKKSEQALIESEETLRLFIEHAPAAIAMFDRDMRYLSVSRRWLTDYRLGDQEIVGRSHYDVFPEISDRVKAIHQRCLNGAVEKSEADSFLRADGTLDWVRWEIHPWRDSQGMIGGIVLFSEVITHHRHIEEAVKRYAQRVEILHQIDMGLIQGGSIHSLVESTLKHIQGIIPCQGASVALFEPEMNEVFVVGLHLPRSSALAQSVRVPVSPDLMKQFGENTLLVVDDLRLLENPVPIQQQLIEEGLRSALYILLPGRDRLRGAFSLVADTVGFFTLEYQEIAVEIASQLAIAIRQWDLSEELAQHAALLERRVAERTAELLAAKERVEAILNSSPDGILLMRADLHIVQINLAFQTMFACGIEDYLHRPFFDLIHPDDVAQTQAAIETGFKDGLPQCLEVRARRQDGTFFEAELSIGYIKQNGLVCSIRDITERKQAEEALRASAAEIHDLYNNAPCGYHSIDKDGVVVQINDTELRWMGYTRDEVVGKLTITDVFTPESVEVFRLNYPGFKARGWVNDLEFDLVCKDGHIVHILLSGTAIYDEQGEYVKSRTSVFDITELKRAQDALKAKMQEDREFQGYLKALYEITVELAQIDRLDEFYWHVVKSGLERLGLERVALFLYDAEADLAIGTYGTDSHGNMVDERHLRFKIADEGVLKQAFEREERIYFADEVPLTGSYREKLGYGWNAATVLWNGMQRLGWLVADNLLSHRPASKPMLEALSLYALTVGTLLVRKQAEAAMRESQERFRHAIEAAPDYVLVYNTEGIIQMVNPTVLADTGYSQADMLGHSITEFLVPKADSSFEQQLQHILKEGVFHQEEQFMRKDGSVVVVDSSGSVIVGEDGRPQSIIVLKRDITQRKQAEDALRQALIKEKELSELKSRFVSMASHEFRTPLASILAATETLTAYRHRLTEEQVEQRLKKIKEQVGYLKDIMEDMLLLAKMQARRVEFTPVLLDLDSLCRSVLDEFRGSPQFGHEVIYLREGETRSVRLDRKLVRQIIGNLVHNAIKYSSADKPVTFHLEYLPDTVVFSVRDEGIGIPDVDQKHLFEPFHRAANVGTISGTGLGLVIVKESVELHGGTITVESQVGAGTTFTITLPARLGEGVGNDKHTGD